MTRRHSDGRHHRPEGRRNVPPDQCDMPERKTKKSRGEIAQHVRPVGRSGPHSKKSIRSRPMPRARELSSDSAMIEVHLSRGSRSGACRGSRVPRATIVSNSVEEVGSRITSLITAEVTRTPTTEDAAPAWTALGSAQRP